MDATGSDAQQKKRRKGATRLSCAECRRLKLRCDRTVPCGSCVKRGCGAICPDGSLTTGQGNRFVLASTQELHEKIQELANRVRSLEDGLRAEHAQLSHEPHPLLSDDLLKIKAPLQREASHNRTPSQVKEEEQSPDVVDAFGSLSISFESGQSKYFGQGSSSWYFLQNESPEDDWDEHGRELTESLGSSILRRASSIPIDSSAPEMEHLAIPSLTWHLPSPDRAQQLCSIYYSHAAWMYNPISQENFESQIFNYFFGNYNSVDDEPLTYHRLSLLYMVLAIGSLMDTSLPAYNFEAEKYHQLAKAALFNYSLFDAPTINGIQALFLMVFYLFLSDRHGTRSGARWALFGIAVKIAQSIGMHRDSGRWKVDDAETQTRRELFWELFTYDSWQSMTFARPPSFSLPHIDCKLPFASDTADQNTYHAWKHRFCSECLNLVQDQAFGAKTPTYATILQLDRKMRAFPVPPILQVAGFGGSGEVRPADYPETTMLTLQRHIVLAIREANLLYLHRSFFARAISDHPKDPLGSPYGTSVIAAYRSAGSLVALMRNLHTQLKEPSERIWFLWTHMFSCSIVLGSIVTRCPSMSLAPSALVQLNSACELFAKAAHGFRAGKVLDIMKRLQQKAHHSLEEYRNGRGSLSKYTVDQQPKPDDEEDELNILGGKTRLVGKKEPGSPLAGLERSPGSQLPVIPLDLSPTIQPSSNPALWAYLDSFNTNPAQNASGVHQDISPTNTQYNVSPSSAGPPSTRGSYDELSPASVYGMSSLSGSSSFHAEPSSYRTQANHSTSRQQFGPNMQYNAYSDQAQPTNSHVQGSINTNSQFPAYFPVYDYGPSAMNVDSQNSIGRGINGSGYGSGLMLEANPIPASQRRLSMSPEGNMQSTWNEFVAGVAM